MVKTFIGGIPFSRKQKSFDKSEDHLPSKIILTLEKGSDSYLKIGDTVNKYTRLTDAKDTAPAVFSGICGSVENIVTTEEKTVLTIFRSGDNEEAPLPQPPKRLSEMTAEELNSILLSRGVPHIKQCGKEPVALTVDCGGNAYNSARIRLCTAYPREMVGGAKIIMKLLGARKCFFAVPMSGIAGAQSIERQLLKGSGMIKVKLIKDKLPACNPNLTVSSVCGVEINAAKDVFDVGYPVISPILCLAAYRALVYGIPFCESFISVTDGDDNTNIYSLPFGSPLDELFDKDDEGIRAYADLAYGTEIKDGVSSYKTEAIRTVAEPQADKQPSSCTHCRRCTEVCPARLVPSDILDVIRRGKTDKFITRYAAGCFECGLCTLVCPSYLPVSDAIADFRRKNGLKPFSVFPYEASDTPIDLVTLEASGDTSDDEESTEHEKVDLSAVFAENGENNGSKSASDTSENGQKSADSAPNGVENS